MAVTMTGFPGRVEWGEEVGEGEDKTNGGFGSGTERARPRGTNAEEAARPPVPVEQVRGGEGKMGGWPVGP
jgi:hypothetical protein